MGKYVSTPVVSLVLKDPANPTADAVTVAVGDTVGLTLVGVGVASETVSGTVVGLSLKQRPQNAKSCRIYDGIPTNQFKTDDMAGLHNAAEYFEGERIAVKLADDTIRIVPVGTIREITITAASEGDGGAEDGTKDPSTGIETE